MKIFLLIAIATCTPINVPQGVEDMSEGQNSVLKVEKRDGQVVDFDQKKIEEAIANAAIAAGKSESYIKNTINGIANEISKEIRERFSGENKFHPNVENIHDIVEKHLVLKNLYEVVKSYILYRAEKKRESDEKRSKVSFLKKLTVEKIDGRKVRFDPKKLKNTIERCSANVDIDQDLIFDQVCKNIFDGIKTTEIEKAIVLSATSYIERDPDYSVFAARVFRQYMAKEVHEKSTELNSQEADKDYRDSFSDAIKIGVKNKIFDARLENFDLEMLAKALKPERDTLFRYISLQTLYQRYFVKFKGSLLELPQVFWMRVAMGLAVNEDKKEERAIEFYEAMSQMLYMPSTPTLFHSGMTHPQLSSCYLTSIDDDLKDIFKSYSDNSQLSKWSGGIGNDWTNVRSIGAHINSTRVESQGTIPFLKIANDTTFAINRSGKRRGATVAYLECWHYDHEDFIELRKNVGDERRRTHDMNTAHWIPDLFMKRVRENGKWTLFSPDEVPELHDLYGKAFEDKYVEYEKKAKRKKLKRTKEVDAVRHYRKMLGMLFETGHPWFCFKDPCNVRSPQDHVGVVHSSNLCTEITLNTKPSKLISEEIDENGVCNKKYQLGEIAVCNLGSLNLPKLINGKKIDKKLMKRTIKTAMRMLDNVIDICFYPVPEARHSNEKHRPVGLGIMGLQDAIYNANLNFEESHNFVDEVQEYISYLAIEESSNLASERGSYSSFEGSKWDRGIFPLDTLKLLEKERGMKIPINKDSRLDWDSLKKKVKEQGMRNSNTMAIAPTATISTICGCNPCFEPQFKNVYVKANMSGEFTIVNEHLVADLKKANLWNKEMLDDLKYHDGSVQKIDKIPNKLKGKYKDAFEVDQKIAVELTALRSKWIDQSQSHNIYMAGKNGKVLSEIYMYAWEMGLKTTYYLRSMGASQIEKSTLDASKYGYTQKREIADQEVAQEPKLCKINDPDCEACD